MTSTDLAHAPRQAVLALAQSLSDGRTVEHLSVPQEGLWLLQIQEPVRHDGFFIGEVPVGQACVALHDGRLGEARGGAILMHADRELATAAAVCDAIARAGWPGADDVGRLCATGAATRDAVAAVRSAILAATRVDFAELGQEGA